MSERRQLRVEAAAVWVALSRAWRRLGGGAGRLVALAVGGSILRSLLVIPVAYLLKSLLDEALPARDTAALVRGSLTLLALFAAAALVNFVARRSVLRLTQNALEQVRLQLLHKLYSLPRRFLDSVDDSDLQTLVIQDSGRLEAILASGVSTLLPAVVVGVSVAGVALVLQPLLLALVAATLPLTLLVARVVVRRVHRRSRTWQETVDDYSSDVSRALRAMTLTKVVGARDVEIARQAATIRRLRDDALGLANEQATARVWLGLSSALGSALLLTVGAIQVSRDELSPGTLLSFYAVIAVLTRQVAIVMSALPVAATAAASYQRIEALLDASAPPPYEGTRPHTVIGEIELVDVSFSYDDSPLLHQVSLRIRAGEHVAILGPNGAGKSTLAMLVLGLYRPDAGRLELDGEPYEELDLDHLHQACGVVLQDPVLLPGTIRQAIAYGRPHVSDLEVCDAARLVGLAEFVETLEDGFDTRIGDDGVGLSGGQRQRVALARALVGRPRVVVLDEPTNHLDDASVHQLLAALASLTPRPTILTITHDLVVAQAADRVVQVRDGRAVEQRSLHAG